jgi:hypothetical protein
LGRMSPAKVDRPAFSFQLPNSCPQQPDTTCAVARESRCKGSAMNMAQYFRGGGGLQVKEGR